MNTGFIWPELSFCKPHSWIYLSTGKNACQPGFCFLLVPIVRPGIHPLCNYSYCCCTLIRSLLVHGDDSYDTHSCGLRLSDTQEQHVRHCGECTTAKSFVLLSGLRCHRIAYGRRLANQSIIAYILLLVQISAGHSCPPPAAAAVSAAGPRRVETRDRDTFEFIYM